MTPDQLISTYLSAYETTHGRPFPSKIIHDCGVYRMGDTGPLLTEKNMVQMIATLRGMASRDT